MRLFLYVLPFFLAAVVAPAPAPAPANSADNNGQENCEGWEGDIIENKDAPTTDESAGLGIEFESPWFYFSSPKCSEDDVNKAKKKLVAGRKQKTEKDDNPLWMLTADTGAGERKLQAEYILDGQQIKIGSGKAAEVAKEIADDFNRWEPWKQRKGKDRVKIDVADTPCDFYIDGPSISTDAKKIDWLPQITAPLPLEALYYLIKERASWEYLPLDNHYFNLIGESTRHPGTEVLVTKKYFEHRPNGIDPDSLTDDTLSFLSLVLTYAKTIAKKPLKKDESVKLRSVFMPRTDFHSLYEQVKSQLPGDLWTIINTISCYKAPDPVKEKIDVTRTVVDQDLCKVGDNKAPVPGKRLEDAEFGGTSIKKWIENLHAEDLLTTFDKTIDGSVGGLGSRMEKVMGTNRHAPLFEYRDLKEQQTTTMVDFAKDVDAKLKELHEKYRQAPRRGN